MLVTLGCAAGDDADDTPEFTAAPPGSFGAAPGSPPPSAAPGAMAASPASPVAPPAASGGTTPAAPGATPGSAPAAPPAGAPEGSNGGVPLAPAAPGATPAASGGGAAAPPADGTAAAPGAGSNAAAPGRVGAELCPPGPFGDPLSPGVQPQQIVALDAGDDFNLEGLVWVGDSLYFSEISMAPNPPPSRINRIVPGAAVERGFIEDSGSNGLAVDAEGNLLAATHDTGAISTFAIPGGGRGQFGAQAFDGQRFNSPNDLVLRSDGNLYFTDPSFQAPGNPQGATRVYRIAPDGSASIVDASLGNPNGITLSPDGNILYVTSAQGLRRYNLAPDGTPDAGENVALQQGLTEPDGMAIDCAGNIYTTEHSSRRIRVFDPAGNQLASVGGDGTLPDNVTNLAFGGPNRTTLFISTLTRGGGGVFALEANIPGLPY